MSFLSFSSELQAGDVIVVPVLKRCHLIGYIQNPNIIEETSQQSEIRLQETVSPNKPNEPVQITGESAFKGCEQALG